MILSMAGASPPELANVMLLVPFLSRTWTCCLAQQPELPVTATSTGRATDEEDAATDDVTITVPMAFAPMSTK